MKLISTIEFKSLSEFFRKEIIGIKPNTVRVVSKKEDQFIKERIEDIKYIRIKNIDEVIVKETFIRELTDITRFESYGLIFYVFSW